MTKKMIGGNNISKAKFIKLEAGTDIVNKIMTEARDASNSHLKNPNLSLPNEFNFLVKSFISFILSKNIL
ncbi:MAG: hypothetical protein AMQ74_01655 [Candidatus Methanofastidiosum methylothiophilum]|uniref:Uncharacterized protein n=1 Tax=Candidatus Methanofastidiosum methylothiophilum TaxID=1705564 RepID=A0A150IS72_9EURY|nr:MAG: hypothetical protein AMQ74_01655 [Candidatus Methanofastidiosum methylthiophilus]